jgi:hypothetical protein
VVSPDLAGLGQGYGREERMGLLNRLAKKRPFGEAIKPYRDLRLQLAVPIRIQRRSTALYRRV